MRRRRVGEWVHIRLHSGEIVHAQIVFVEGDLEDPYPYCVRIPDEPPLWITPGTILPEGSIIVFGRQVSL